MAVVTSKPDLVFTASRGSEIVLEWTVHNLSTQAWPCCPVLMNMTTGEKIQIQKILSPQDSTLIQYKFTVPETEECIHVFKLHLVDPFKFEKFGDPMTAVCSV